MQITCLGAARTVTGSSFLVETEKLSFLVDCGMFQGGRQIEARNFENELYQPLDIAAIFITHAHIDHSGLVPRLVRLGYRGPVFATAPTCELLHILWLDAANIQEMEARWQSRKNRRRGRGEVEPLYEKKDAEEAADLLKPVEMEIDQDLLPGVTTRFVGAGHILGAASLHVSTSTDGRRACLGFSGDLGRPDQLIVPDPERLPNLDVVFLETTYGNRLHKDLAQSQDELIEVVKQAYAAGGKVLIPAFAVERTQEIIYTFAAAFRRGEFPADMPVFLDSPLAIKATEIFRRWAEYFDQQTQDILAKGHTPLNFPNLKFTPSTEESMAINRHQGPAVIIAGNGMASAGRIKHHLKHNLWRPETHLVIVGFQAQGTTGRRLVEGAPTVRIFREEVSVRAAVHTIGGFSAHADRDELLAWLRPLARPGLRVNLVHGEERAASQFKKIAKARFPGLRFHIPRWKETIRLAGHTTAEEVPAPAPDQAPAAAPQETGPAAVNLPGRLTALAQRLAHGELPPQQTKALEQALQEAENALAGETA